MPIFNKTANNNVQQKKATPPATAAPQQAPVKKEVVAAPPRPKPKKLSAGKSMLGISLSLTNKKDTGEEEPTTHQTTGKTQTFSVKQLNDCWIEYIKRIPSDQLLFRQSLSSAKLVLKKNTVLVTNENSFQKEKLEDSARDILNFLRTKLQNDNISIRFDFNKSVTTEKVFTDNDRWEAMVKENPALEILKNKLGLELD